MDNKLSQYSTDKYPTDLIGRVVDELAKSAQDTRRNFEKRWYDNNFFDDGFHFRYYTRSQNKITDLSSRASIYEPLRAIPKASRQIRGLANLLISADPIPVI